MHLHIYNALLTIACCLFGFVVRIGLWRGRSKFTRFWIQQEYALASIQKGEQQNHDSSRQTIWIHAASYGEYNVVSPIMESLSSAGKYRIVLTFFSPTGLEISGRKKLAADAVYALPMDTRKNVHAFLDAVRPVKAVFAVSEYWVNYLTELHSRNIPAYLISARITKNAPFMRWYGGLWKNAVKLYAHVMTVDEKSSILLRSIKIANVSVTGDPLFDSVVKRTQEDYSNTIVESFAKDGDVFIAGSLHNDKDLSLVSSLANRHREIKFLLVPHEISEEILNKIISSIDGRTRLYPDCSADTDFSDTQVLVIDFTGALFHLYGYAKWAYVGGGFTRYLHSVLEPVAFGLPVAFGPHFDRQIGTRDIINNGIGSSIQTKRELEQWFSELKANDSSLVRIKDTSAKYINQNKGAAVKVLSIITA